MDLNKRLKIRIEKIAEIYRQLYNFYGYERAPPGVLPGDSFPKSAYIRKGLVWVNLSENTGLVCPGAQNFCGMRINVPIDLPIPKHLENFLFARAECGSGKYLTRVFPYTLTQQGYHYTYILFITDTDDAAKIIDKEVNFTASMIEPVLNTLNLSARDLYKSTIKIRCK